MAQALLELVDDQLRLSGVLDYSTGAALRKQGQALIKSSSAKTLLIDCASVEKSSSVGLSLLLAFMRDGQSCGKAIEVRAMPQDLRQIAQVTGMTELFSHV